MRLNSFKKSVAIAASLVLASVGLSAQAAHAAPITINLYEATEMPATITAGLMALGFMQSLSKDVNEDVL